MSTNKFLSIFKKKALERWENEGGRIFPGEPTTTRSTEIRTAVDDVSLRERSTDIHAKPRS
jgi:hypothetical protein